MERLIGIYDEGRPGPLFICFGALHGNETAGIKAIALMLKMLEVEHITNPEFEFRGRFVGLVGNLAAAKSGQRYIKKDLNRQWSIEKIQGLAASDPTTLEAEDLEMYELEKLVTSIIRSYQSERTVILDLHTTSAEEGIFTIVPNHPLAIRFAMGIKAPVVLGFLEGLAGTTLHYFTSENFPGETTSICFESGNHNDPLSVNRSIAAITNCLRYADNVDEKHIESRHIHILEDFSKSLPHITQLVYRHGISPEDQFVMEPGFVNFSPVVKGQLLAHDCHGPIFAKHDGYVLMPMYQKQGEDGFFIVADVMPDMINLLTGASS